jgi:hypothetical protein
LKIALLIYAALALLGLLFLRDPTMRLVLWIFLAGLALKSYVAWLQRRQE